MTPKEKVSRRQKMAIDVAFTFLIIVGDRNVKKQKENWKIVLKASLRKAIRIQIIVTFNSSAQVDNLREGKH